jgi:hypothetical protein
VSAKVISEMVGDDLPVVAAKQQLCPTISEMLLASSIDTPQKPILDPLAAASKRCGNIAEKLSAVFDAGTILRAHTHECANAFSPDFS